MFKKITLLTLLLSLNTYSSAPAPAPQPAPAEQNKPAFVWGTMYLVGNMMYLGEDPNKLLMHSRLKNILDAHRQPIALKSSDVTVHVWVASEKKENGDINESGSDNWSDHGHPIIGKAFPSALPLAMLDGKTEDQPLQFSLKCPKTQKIFEIIVRCKGRNCERHEEQLERLKERFSATPNFYCSDERRLLQQEIIVKNPEHEEMQKLKDQLKDFPDMESQRVRQRLVFEGHMSFAQLTVAMERSQENALERRRLLQAIEEKKKKWQESGHTLDSFEGIPRLSHGPNGFKYMSPAPAQIRVDSLPSDKTATQSDEMDQK